MPGSRSWCWLIKMLCLRQTAEVEDGLAEFLQSQVQAKAMQRSVDAADKAVRLAIVQYKGGLVDFNRVALLQQNLVQQQDLLAQAQGDIALGLIHTYRALGGGWEIRCIGFGGLDQTAAAAGPKGESIPPGKPAPGSATESTGAGTATRIAAGRPQGSITARRATGSGFAGDNSKLCPGHRPMESGLLVEQLDAEFEFAILHSARRRQTGGTIDSPASCASRKTFCRGADARCRRSEIGRHAADCPLAVSKPHGKLAG